MMKTFSFICAFILSVTAVTLSGQVSSYYDLEIESDALTTEYKPAGKNYVHLRSKRGTSGMNKTPEGDQIIAMPVKEIVLVFTESNEEDEIEREDANMERWDNLIMTYPQYFQPGTVYKSLCQCNYSGDQELYKKLQGFYVYYQGPAPAEKKPEVARTEPKSPEPPAKKEEPVKKAEPKTEVAVEKPARQAEEKPAKTAEAAPVEKKEEKVAKNEPPPPPPAAEEPAEEEEPVAVKKPAAKKPVTGKPRRAKDPKACRPACYEGGDEDLHNFFARNITLTKKQRRKGKHLNALVRLQLNPDGTIKKSTVTGQNTAFNKQVEDAVNMMNAWNSTVKNGVAIKSEVRLTLKYDKSTKAIKPFEVAVMPRMAPKCKCASDAEIFGD